MPEQNWETAMKGRNNGNGKEWVDEKDILRLGFIELCDMKDKKDKDGIRFGLS